MEKGNFFVREGVCVWDIQDSGCITELGLSLKQAWRIDSVLGEGTGAQLS